MLQEKIKLSFLIRAIIVSLIVSSITLVVTKSKLMACKRKYVQDRYDFVKANNEKPSIIHEIWLAVWTCPMCSGYWFAMIVSLFYFERKEYIPGVLISAFLNYMWHCVEERLIDFKASDR